MKLILLIWMLGALVPAHAQKKLLPVASSTLTGISLPPDSKQDQRGLSLLSARTLLEEVAKKNGSSIESNAVEVLELSGAKKAGFVIDSFYSRLRLQGWTIMPIDGEKGYAWLLKENQYILSYWGKTLGVPDIYLGKANAAPALAGFTQPQTLTADNKPAIPAPAVAVSEEAAPPITSVKNTEVKPVTGGFTFTSTNFDDGWVSTIEEDKVVVSKGAVKVYIYYPLAWDDQSRAKGRDYFWDEKLPASFRILSKQYRDGGEYISSLKPPYVEGRAVEISSGRTVFIALYTGSGSGSMYPTLAVAPDEASIRTHFPKAEDKYSSDLAAMRTYNKFAVALPDIRGYWVGGDATALNYYHAYTGNYMGMDAAVTSDEFRFNQDGSYTSEHKGATGMVGSMKTFQQKYKGSVKVSNWEITMDHRWQGNTYSYYAYFEVVSGGRVLHLQDKKASSMWFHLVKKGD